MEKARGFNRERNLVQALRYADLALTKLKQLKDRSLAFVEVLDNALAYKFNALNFMGRDKEALEFATERYNMWATTYMRNPCTIEAAFPLIESLMHNKEFVQAQLIASTVYEMTMHPMTHDIPGDKQQQYLAKAASFLARAILFLAQADGIPPDEERKTGEEAIALARKALAIHTLLYGAESESNADVATLANDIATLAKVLLYFNIDSVEEGVRLYEQSTAMYNRVEGSSSVNVASNKRNLGALYITSANRAGAADELDRALANMELALPHLRDAARIYRAINHVDSADEAAKIVMDTEERIRFVRIQITARAATAAAT